MKLYAFCCIIFLRDLLMRFHAFLPLWDVLMKFVAFRCILFWCDTLMNFLEEISCFLAAEFSFLMVWCTDGGKVGVEGCERLNVYDGFVWTSWVVRWLGNECKFCGGGWCKCEYRRVCVEAEDSFHQHALHPIDTYVWGWCNVTWTCSCDSRRFTRWFGFVEWCM